MSVQDEFPAIFSQLRSVLRKYAAVMDCPTDEPHEYSLNTRHIMKNRQALFFGAALIKKNYVSYHLMPVYVFPELVAHISPQLRKRMHGKSCFNFRNAEEVLFEELEALTEQGYRKYRDSQYV